MTVRRVGVGSRIHGDKGLFGGVMSLSNDLLNGWPGMVTQLADLSLGQSKSAEGSQRVLGIESFVKVVVCDADQELDRTVAG